MKGMRALGPVRALPLILPVFLSLAGCSGSDHQTEPARARSVLLTLRYPNESLAVAVARIDLRIVDSEGDLTGPTRSSPVTGDSVSFQDVELPDGIYLFLVELFDDDDNKVGHGETEVEIGSDMEIQITIAVIALPGDFDIDVDVDWTAVGDSCYVITPRLFAGRLPVYRDDDEHTLNRFSPSGWMGEVDSIEIDVSSTSNVHEGATCVRATVHTLPVIPDTAWAGVFWLPVPKVRSDWSNLVFGYDLRGMSRLRWWARGASGGERVEFVAGGVWGGTVRCDDSLFPELRLEVDLTTAWQEYGFDLSELPPERLQFVVGGFGWVVKAPAGVTFYLDDIEYIE